MSRSTDALVRAREHIAAVLLPVPSRSRRIVHFELAMEHAEAWAADQPPKGDERGGSSSPREASDRREEAGVKRRAAQAATRLTASALLVEKLMDEMYRDVIFLTSITDDDPDEEAGELPGCKSCARIGVRIEVYEKSKSLGLCRWCWEHRPTEDQLPPVDLLRLHHDGTRSEVSKWLAKNMPTVKRDESPSCGTRYTHLGRDHICHRAVGHDGECAGVGANGERVTWVRAA